MSNNYDILQTFGGITLLMVGVALIVFADGYSQKLNQEDCQTITTEVSTHEHPQ